MRRFSKWLKIISLSVSFLIGITNFVSIAEERSYEITETDVLRDNISAEKISVGGVKLGDDINKAAKKWISLGWDRGEPWQKDSSSKNVWYVNFFDKGIPIFEVEIVDEKISKIGIWSNFQNKLVGLTKSVFTEDILDENSTLRNSIFGKEDESNIQEEDFVFLQMAIYEYIYYRKGFILNGCVNLENKKTKILFTMFYPIQKE